MKSRKYKTNPVVELRRLTEGINKAFEAFSVSPKRLGRPPGSKNKVKAKRRGRPLGSKNKVKRSVREPEKAPVVSIVPFGIAMRDAVCDAMKRLERYDMEFDGLVHKQIALISESLSDAGREFIAHLHEADNLSRAARAKSGIEWLYLSTAASIAALMKAQRVYGYSLLEDQNNYSLWGSVERVGRLEPRIVEMHDKTGS